MTPPFRALSFYYVNLCNHVWFYNSREVRFHMIKSFTKDENISDKKQMFLVRSQVISLLVDGTITKRYPENCC